MPAECAVGRTTGGAETLSVEVSGWDAEGQFFTEIADLDWSDTGDNTARLRHRITSGSLVFVRLMHSKSAYPHGHDKNHPTAHEVHAVTEPDFTGRCRVRLAPCQPRAARRLGDQNVGSRI